MDAPGEYCIAPGERLPLAAGCIFLLWFAGGKARRESFVYLPPFPRVEEAAGGGPGGRWIIYLDLWASYRGAAGHVKCGFTRAPCRCGIIYMRIAGFAAIWNCNEFPGSTCRG